jgi:hypothetical protein
MKQLSNAAADKFSTPEEGIELLLSLLQNYS